MRDRYFQHKAEPWRPIASISPKEAAYYEARPDVWREVTVTPVASESVIERATEALASHWNTQPVMGEPMGEQRRLARALAKAGLLAGPRVVTKERCCAPTTEIEGHWLVDRHDHHTCGTGPDGYYGAHEPDCGTEPVVDLRGLPGWETLAGPRPLPEVAHKGPHDTDASMFAQAADNLDRGYPLGGGNLTRAVVELIRREVSAAKEGR